MDGVDVKLCQDIIQAMSVKWGHVYVPEFTFGEYRIDAAVIDIKTRWIRGYEIKMTRSDFLRDEKWQMYSQFLSSLSIVCPHGLIEKKEIPDPFGLMYVTQYGVEWMKRPKRFQKRGGLAWTWTYLDVLEKEMPRMQWEITQLSEEIKRLKHNKHSLIAEIPCLSE